MNGSALTAVAVECARLDGGDSVSGDLAFDVVEAFREFLITAGDVAFVEASILDA
jgi:hypothetical protein